MILSQLPLICDLMWSYFILIKKTITLKEALLSHLGSAHPRRPSYGFKFFFLKKLILVKAELDQCLKELFNLVPSWCFTKEIDGRAWIKIVKQNETYLEAKSIINNLHQKEKDLIFEIERYVTMLLLLDFF